MKQTPMQQLVELLKINDIYKECMPYLVDIIEEVYIQKEREELLEAWRDGYGCNDVDETLEINISHFSAESYYTGTFGIKIPNSKLPKTFSDLKFHDHPAPYVEGVQALMDFDNGWSISVVQTSSSYGGSQGLFELAVFKDGNIHYDNPVSNGDVLGYLTEKQVTEAMKAVQEFDKADQN